jgi:transposase
MILIGCDFHPSFQQIAKLNTETGEIEEQRIVHGDQQLEKFYGDLPAPALIGVESVGNCHWFLDMLDRLGHKVWVGDAAQIRASYVRKQKTDRRDARHILTLLMEERFPRVWLPTAQARDMRQLLLHRHKLVQITTRVKNELQHLMLNKGIQKKAKLWTQQGRTALMALPMQPNCSQRRQDLLQLLGVLEHQVNRLDRAIAEAAERCAEARLLMTQPGVGSVTALAFVLTIGDVNRFHHSRQVTSYLGLIPREHSSGGKQKMGTISKQGNRLLRFLLVEAAGVAVRFDPELRTDYLHRCHKKHRAVARVAAARKLAVRLYWMLRTQTPYPQVLSSRVA